MPEAVPPAGNYQAVVAFTNLNFYYALGLTYAPGTNHLCVWEREGRVFMLVYYTWVPPGTVVGSPTKRPDTIRNGYYHDRLSRFTLDTNGVAIPGSELVLIDLTANTVWHKGGGMFFHPQNGFLYVTDGDDQTSPNEAQIITNSLFGGVWRIDVDQRGGSVSHPAPRQPRNGATANYYIPNDNPFVGQPGVMEEFFAIGLRSPHRMTYDPVTGRIFIGDVGFGTREELDVIEPTDPPGLNFQWPQAEGNLGSLQPPYVGVSKPPILDYDRTDGAAIIGGYVYRGSEFPELNGKYIFGDNITRNIWALDESGGTPQKNPSVRGTARLLHQRRVGSSWAFLVRRGPERRSLHGPIGRNERTDLQVRARRSARSLPGVSTPALADRRIHPASVSGVHQARQAHLMHVAETLGREGLLLGRAESWQKQGGENRNDCDDDQ
jgi:hypothetical protein